jgi:CBS domain containing-hemolysin-like protein
MLVLFLIVLTVTCFNAYLCILESSLVSIDDLRLVTLLRKHPDNKELIKRMFLKRRECISALLLINNIGGILGSTFAGTVATKYLDGGYIVLFTIITAYVITVFGKILPKLFGMQDAEKIVIKHIPIIYWIERLTYPLRKLTLFWAKLFPKKIEEQADTDDLLSIIKHFNAKGIIGKRETSIAQSALKAKNKTLKDLESEPVYTLPYGSTIGSIEHLVTTSPQKRYLVIKNGTPEGMVLYHKILECLVYKKQDIPVDEIMQKVIVLPIETSLLSAIKQFHPQRAAQVIVQTEDMGNTSFQRITAKKIYRALIGADNDS